MEVLVGLGGLLVLVGAGTRYLSEVDSHKATRLREAPLINLEKSEDVERWKASLAKGDKEFVKVIGTASVGIREPLRKEGETRDLVFYRKLTKGRAVQVPWSPLSFYSVSTKGHREFDVTQPNDERAKVWGLQHQEGQRQVRFIEISSKFRLENDDLLLLSQTEKPTGLPYLSGFLFGWPYPYAYIFEERGLPVGSRVLVTGQAGISEETGNPIILPPKGGLWPDPNIITTRPPEDWYDGTAAFDFLRVDTLENKANNLRTVSTGVLVLGVAMMAVGKFRRNDE